jgi:hypothetical protein
MDQVATAGGAVSGCVWSISRLSADLDKLAQLGHAAAESMQEFYQGMADSWTGDME